MYDAQAPIRESDARDARPIWKLVERRSRRLPAAIRTLEMMCRSVNDDLGGTEQVMKP